MMPRGIPNPLFMIYFTGVCEILGAIGLLLPATRRAAAMALVAFFVAIFPANVKAARAGIGVGGKTATALWLRAPMQLLFIGLTWWSGVASRV